jgi:hypothetical protein
MSSPHMCIICLHYINSLPYFIPSHLLFACSLPSILLLHLLVTHEFLIALLIETYECIANDSVIEESASVSSNQPVIMYKSSWGVGLCEPLPLS